MDFEIGEIVKCLGYPDAEFEIIGTTTKPEFDFVIIDTHKGEAHFPKNVKKEQLLKIKK